MCRAGSGRGCLGLCTAGSVDNTSCTRTRAAAARWPNATIMPMLRSGHTNIVRYTLNATKSPMLRSPLTTRCPPYPNTAMSPNDGSKSMAGRNRLRMLAALRDTALMSSASLRSFSNCTLSVPRPFTTRTPDTLSSTTLASCACSFCTASTAGWIRLENLLDATLMNGNGANATIASRQSVNPRISVTATSWATLLNVIGIITTNCCTCCRSLEARLINCPVCVRS